MIHLKELYESSHHYYQICLYFVVCQKILVDQQNKEIYLNHQQWKNAQIDHITGDTSENFKVSTENGFVNITLTSFIRL